LTEWTESKLGGGGTKRKSVPENGLERKFEK